MKSLPLLVLCMVSSAVTSGLITRFGAYRWALWLGSVITVIGSSLLVLLDHDSAVVFYTFFFVIYGTGLGIGLAAVNIATQAAVTAADSGRATMLYTFVRSVGMCLGMGMGQSIFLNAMKRNLRVTGLGCASHHAVGVTRFTSQDTSHWVRARFLPTSCSRLCD